MSTNKSVDPLSALKGKKAVFHASEEIGKLMIRRFAAAAGDHNPLYWDEEYAKKSPYGGITAPPTLIFELAFGYDIGGDIDDEDGLYKGFKDWFHPLTDLQRAGNEYEIYQPLRPGDVVKFRRRIVDVTQKQTKRGNLLFITSEITYTNQKGELLGIDKETMVGELE